MANFNTPNALDWLGKDQKTAKLLGTARSLIAIEKLISKLVPKALAKNIKVGNLSGHKLTLIVPGPAHAARLNQISATVAQQLNLNGWNINRITVRIDAHRDKDVLQQSHKKINNLSQETIAKFIELEKNVAPGPLAEAIKQLITHHSNS